MYVYGMEGLAGLQRERDCHVAAGKSEMPGDEPLILVIEDETLIRNSLVASLIHAGYRVSQAATGCHGLGEFVMQKPDAIVLDLGLPDVAGAEIVRQVRERSAVPIVALSKTDTGGETAAAVDAGANAVVADPFDTSELLSRLQHLLSNRAPVEGEAEENHFTVGDLIVDLTARRVTLKGRKLSLTPPEFTLLATLIHHSGRVVTYRCLINQIWHSQKFWQIAYLKLLVSGLRQKLEPDPVHPRYVLTERGVGYRLAAV
jgi:two-component system KDP operon response regulator KdpE